MSGFLKAAFCGAKRVAIVDFETLGLSTRSVVTSLGVVVLDTENERIDPDLVFYENVKIAPSASSVRGLLLGNRIQRFLSSLAIRMTTGAEMTESTVQFWRDQLSKQGAGQAAILGYDGTKPLSMKEMMSRLIYFLQVNEIDAIAGFGASFDNALVEELFRRCNLKNPISYRKSLCVRTVMGQMGVTKEDYPKDSADIRREMNLPTPLATQLSLYGLQNTHHHGFFDAYGEAKALLNAYRRNMSGYMKGFRNDGSMRDMVRDLAEQSLRGALDLRQYPDARVTVEDVSADGTATIHVSGVEPEQVRRIFNAHIY